MGAPPFFRANIMESEILIMNKMKFLFFAGVLALTLAGCSAVGGGETENNVSVPDADAVLTEIQIPEDASFDADNFDIEPEPFVPTEKDVLHAREKALEGMTEEQMKRLKLVVKEANLWWEHRYLYENIFGLLEDPDHPIWNCFDQKGEIQIGWAVDGNLDMDVSARKKT